MGNSFFYKCRSCGRTFPVFAGQVEICSHCNSPDIEESPEVGLGERLERGAIYDLNFVTVSLTKIGKPAAIRD